MAFSPEQFERVRNSIVRIEAGPSSGTGFFVAEDLIVTCAHVIRGWDGAVTVTHDGSGHVAVVEMVGEGVCDLATLRTEKKFARFLPVAAPAAFGVEVFSAGFQFEKDYELYSLTMQLGAPVYAKAPAGDRLDWYRLIGDEVSPGMSGAPVYSPVDDCVVAVVNRSRGQTSGYAVPVTHLWRLDASLGEELERHKARIASPLRDYLARLETRLSPLDGVADADEHLSVLSSISPTIQAFEPGLSASFLRVDGLVDSRAEASGDFGAWQDAGKVQGGRAFEVVTPGDIVNPKLALLTGPPGSGKTTVLRQLACDSAVRATGSGIVPVFVPLKRLAGRSEDLSLADLAEATDIDVVAKSIEAGRAQLLLDGLDELPPRLWRGLFEIIKDVADRGNSTLVTCREANLDRTRIPAWCRYFRILPLSQPQREAILRVLTRGDTDLQGAVSATLSTSAALSQLAGTPLFLKCLTTAASSGNLSAAATPAAVVLSCLRALLEWRSERHTISVGPQATIDWLAQLASLVQQSGGEEVSKADAGRLAMKCGVVADAAAANAIVDQLILVDGAMIEPVAGRVTFIHRQFLEVLVGVTVAKAGDANRLREFTRNPLWYECAVFAAQLGAWRWVGRVCAQTEGAAGPFALVHSNNLWALRLVAAVPDVPMSEFSRMLSRCCESADFLGYEAAWRDLIDVMSVVATQYPRYFAEAWELFDARLPRLLVVRFLGRCKNSEARQARVAMLQKLSSLAQNGEEQAMLFVSSLLQFCDDVADNYLQRFARKCVKSSSSHISAVATEFLLRAGDTPPRLVSGPARSASAIETVVQSRLIEFSYGWLDWRSFAHTTEAESDRTLRLRLATELRLPSGEREEEELAAKLAGDCSGFLRSIVFARLCQIAPGRALAHLSWFVEADQLGTALRVAAAYMADRHFVRFATGLSRMPEIQPDLASVNSVLARLRRIDEEQAVAIAPALGSAVGLKVASTQTSRLQFKDLRRLILDEQDVAQITNLLGAIACLDDADARRWLIEMSDTGSWPKAWPPLRPPLGRGEQRAADRRHHVILAAVVAGGDKDGARAALRLVRNPATRGMAAVAYDALRSASRQELGMSPV